MSKKWSVAPVAQHRSRSTGRVGSMQQTPESNGRWTFLTNHAHVLLSIANDPELRLRDIAETVGITERAAQRIVSSLVADGYLVRSRVGRRSRYKVTADLSLRHSIESHHTVGELVDLLSVVEAAGPASRSRPKTTRER